MSATTITAEVDTRPRGIPLNWAARVLNITALPWLVGAAALAALVYFDLGPPLAFNDDWGFAWSVRHFSLGRFQVYPASSAMALPQIFFAAMLGQTDQRALRLTLVPFVLLASFCLYRLSRRLGADTFWSSVAAVAPASLPVFMADATTFMSDVPCAALLLGFALSTVNWFESRSRMAALGMIVFAALAILQREPAVAAPPAAILVATLTLRLERRDRWTLALLAGMAAAALVAPTVLHIAPPTQGNRLQALFQHWVPGYPAWMIIDTAPALGLALVPFTAAVWLARSQPRAGFGARLLMSLVLATGAIAWFYWNFFPNIGDVLKPFGFVALDPNHQFKPVVVPPWVSVPLWAAALVAVCVVLIRRHSLVWERQSRPGAVLLAVLAASQIIPYFVLTYLGFDRYYIPAAVLVVPLGALAATRASGRTLARSLAVACLVPGFALYAVVEQDYQAWQAARNSAALLAYSYADPLDVNAGYEANAVYGEVPVYDRTGRILSDLADNYAWDFSLNGPLHPKIVLATVHADHAGIGVSYRSIAPGRVILVWIDSAGKPRLSPP